MHKISQAAVIQNEAALPWQLLFLAAYRQTLLHRRPTLSFLYFGCLQRPHPHFHMCLVVKGRGTRYCFNCGETDHTVKTCRRPLFCKHCRRYGHTSNVCFKKQSEEVICLCRWISASFNGRHSVPRGVFWAVMGWQILAMPRGVLTGCILPSCRLVMVLHLKSDGIFAEIADRKVSPPTLLRILGTPSTSSKLQERAAWVRKLHWFVGGMSLFRLDVFYLGTPPPRVQEPPCARTNPWFRGQILASLFLPG